MSFQDLHRSFTGQTRLRGQTIPMRMRMGISETKDRGSKFVDKNSRKLKIENVYFM